MSSEDLLRWPGLTKAEAAKRLTEEGYNELPTQKKRTFWQILIKVISEPILLLLIGSGTVYILIGEIKDALMLLTFVFVVIGITFYQERKTEKTLDALKNLSSPRAIVIRESKSKRIPGREVVRGDIVYLQEGDRIPADALILSCTNLLVDESLLTGESISVRKTAWDGKILKQRPGGDDLPFIYSGSLIVGGWGIAQVIAIGSNTEIGKIGKSIKKIKEENTLLQKETARIVRYFTIAGLFLCLLIVFLYTFIKGDLLVGFLSGLTLSMAILPEEFPVVLLIFLTLGAWRISKKQVLTRKPAVIETLGAATTLCVDKTGTLTYNRMQLTQLYAKKMSFIFTDKLEQSLPEDFHELIEYADLASQKDPFDPIEKEIKETGIKYLKDTEHIHSNWGLVKEYPLSKELLSLSHVWQSPDKNNYMIAAKGAPEAIAELCHLKKGEKEKILHQVLQMAGKGLRVLAVAKALFKRQNLPGNQHDFSFDYVGLLGFVDPVRKTIPAALKEAYQAGIKVMMITGDYPGTAVYVAKQIGLKNPEDFLTGEELTKLDHIKLREKIKTVNICARVVPEQKLAIVNALKANDEIVAMTGDGINDAPALKAAHIGIAMGERGTDVAREAASLVLLNDDFSSIIAAVRLGRRIFDNLRKAMGYIFSIHIPIAGMSLLPIIFNLPIVLFPVQIAFLELIIDPACSTVFEAQPEEKNIMNRPPRNLYQPLFNKRTVITGLLQGLSVLGIVFTFFVLALRFGKSDLEACTIAFIVLVLANLMLIITNLSLTQNIIQTIKTPNKALWLVLTGASLALLFVLYLSFLRNLFHFSYLSLSELFLCLFTALFTLLWFEAMKKLMFKIHIKN